nr:hypothetical protein [Tanacetum cinerariifolium]
MTKPCSSFSANCLNAVHWSLVRSVWLFGYSAFGVWIVRYSCLIDNNSDSSSISREMLLSEAIPAIRGFAKRRGLCSPSGFTSGSTLKLHHSWLGLLLHTLVRAFLVPIACLDCDAAVVRSFDMSVGLWVFEGCKSLFDIQFFAPIFKWIVSKLFFIVGTPLTAAYYFALILIARALFVSASRVPSVRYSSNENGNAPIVTKTIDGKETVIPPTSVEKKAQRRAELKSYQVEEGATNFALMAYSLTSSSSSTNSEIMDKCKTGLGYNVVPPPYSRNFMPPKPDLVYPSLDDFVDVNESVSESIVKNPAVESHEPKIVRKENGAPIIEDWVSKSEEEDKMPINNRAASKNSKNNQKVNSVRAKKVNTARPKVVLNVVKENHVNAVKASACWVRRPKHKVLDHVSRNNNALITFKRFDYVDAQGRSKSYLTDYKEIDGRFVAFGDFKLADESHVLLKVPRKDNMYSVDLNNIVPQKGLTCLFEKATSKESNLWHRRLGHVEAVNTACYVQNRVLVIKPHNKTPYELFIGRKHALSFMRPFGCPVTILNTIDHLGKFNGKVDERFFVGYSTNSKAFRVFNSRTRIVEENMHVKCSENTPNIVGSGPNWLFDIYALTKSMNYKLVVTGNQSNGSVGPKACDIIDSPSAGYKPSWEEEKKDAEDLGNEDNEAPRTEEPRVNKKKDSVNSTNRVNVVSSTVNAAINEVNAIGRKSSIELPDDPNMPELEDISIFKDSNRDVFGAEADLNKLESTFQVFRNKLDERGIVIGNKARLVAQGHTQEEGIYSDEVFAPVARIKAIRLFLAYASFKDFMVYQMDVGSAFLYGKIEEEVYVCQPPDFEDPDFPDRVYKREMIDKALFIKRDKRDILLVQVYVDDIIFGSTRKEMCAEFEKMMHKKFQISSIGELTFLLGLHVKQKEDGIFISQDKYVNEILTKFGFSDVKTTSTPIETHKTLLKDEKGEDVDEHLYRSMIGSLMYLTCSRPDIMFAICAYARFQVNPKILHLHAVKRSFRYIKGQPKLGLWYPKDSPFDLVAYTNSDYARASLDRKSTTGVKNLVFYAKTKHIKIRHHFIRDSNEKKLIHMIKIHIDKNVTDLLTKAFDNINGEAQLHANVDEKKVVISEASIRRDLRLSARVESSTDEESLGEEDASKQGRISNIDANQYIYFVNVHRDDDIFSVNDPDDTLMFDADKDLQGEEVVVEKEVDGKDVSAVKEINAASIASTVIATTPTFSTDEITLAKALIKIKTSRPKAKEIVMQDPSETSTPTPTASSQ